MTGKLDWEKIEAVFELGGYEVGAGLTDSAAFLALLGLTLLQPKHLWQNYEAFDDVETAIDDAIAQIMNGVSVMGDFVKIAEEVRTADAISVMLQNFLVGDYRAFELWVSGLKSDDTTLYVDDVIMILNGDQASPNYNTLSIYETDDDYLRYVYFGSFPGIRMEWATTTVQANNEAVGYFKMRFHNPQVGDWKTIEWEGTSSDILATRLIKTKGLTIWEDEAAITSITFWPRLGTTFLVDPEDAAQPSELRATLYGLR